MECESGCINASLNGNPMRWISKYPPIYIREGDEWYDEVNKICYQCNIKERTWWQTGRPNRPFQPKTKIFPIKDTDKIH